MQAVMSEQFGMLTRFLPMMNDLAQRACGTEELTNTAAYRVVILEGSSSLARLLATGLKAESLAVEVAPHLDGVRTLLSKRSSNLLILDLDIADFDGPAMLAELRAQYPELSIL